MLTELEDAPTKEDLFKHYDEEIKNNGNALVLRRYMGEYWQHYCNTYNKSLGIGPGDRGEHCSMFTMSYIIESLLGTKQSN